MASAQDVIDRARQLINDVASEFVAGLRWGDAEMLQWLTDAQREVVKLKPEANVVTDWFAVASAFPRQRLDSTVAYRLIRVEANGTGSGTEEPVEGAAVTVPDGENAIQFDSIPEDLPEYTLTGWFKYQDGEVKQSPGNVLMLLGREAEFHQAFNSVEPEESVRLDVGWFWEGEDPEGADLVYVGDLETPPADTWVFFAFIYTAEQLRSYWAVLGDTTFAASRKSTLVDIGGPSLNDLTHIMVGNDPSLQSPFVGDVTQVRLWTRNLSEAELIAEKNSSTVVSMEDLWSSNPLSNSSDTSDESGNDRTVTFVGTILTAEFGPGN